MDTRSHYEVLGVEPDAAREQIDKAYQFSLAMYDEGALALYSLLSEDEARAARDRVQEAFDVLSDPARRREYDISQMMPAAGAGEGRERAEVVRFAPRGGERHPVVEDEGPRIARRGAELKSARERMGVSLREIASRSKVGLRFLEYLEQERFDMLPAPVYVRGFIVEYARAVGLEPRATAEAILGLMARRTNR